MIFLKHRYLRGKTRAFKVSAPTRFTYFLDFSAPFSYDFLVDLGLILAPFLAPFWHLKSIKKNRIVLALCFHRFMMPFWSVFGTPAGPKAAQIDPENKIFAGVDLGPILGRFRSDFGCILDPFSADFGPLGAIIRAKQKGGLRRSPLLL